MQGHFLLQNRDYHAVPYSMGIEPGEKIGVLPINEFLKKGSFQFKATIRTTPLPTMELLEDDVVHHPAGGQPIGCKSSNNFAVV